MLKVSPSILAADLGHLYDEIKRTEDAGVDFFHLDIMDGHFVPNLTFGPGMVKFVNANTDIPLDVHLMISNPGDYLEVYTQAGADVLTIHYETVTDPVGMLKSIHGLGIQAGISISPNTPFEAARDCIPESDWLLVMSVHPGFAGQKFIPASTKKVSAARQFIDSQQLKCAIAVDGGIDMETAPRVVKAGADIVITGSSFYKSENYADFISNLRQVVDSGADNA